MRRLAVGVCVLAVYAGCSGSSGSPACRIAGSYTASATDVRGNCPIPSGVIVTDTITARPPGATGPDFYLQITGVQGGCYLNLVDTCKVQGKCDVTFDDALNPSNATGTTQYSWAFSDSGFTGTSTAYYPPTKSLASGCNGQATVTGTRQ